MSNSADEALHIPKSHSTRPDLAAEARARIAALTDSHLQGDHPLLKDSSPVSATEVPPEPPTKKVETDLPGKKLTSQIPPAGMPAEWVSNNRKIRPLPSKARPIVSAVASFLLLLVVFKSEIIISQIKYWTTKAQPVAQTTPAAKTAVVGPASLIQIPKIKVNAPVVYQPSINEAAVLKSLQNGVVHYGTTPNPGEPGNSVIVGHSSNDWWQPGHYKFVFVLLDKMVVGDKFSINYKSRHYIYQVTKTKIVQPTDLTVLRQTTEPTVTLITCTPPGTSWRRLVVSAKQISPTPQTYHSPPVEQAGIDLTKIRLPGSAPGFLSQIGQFFSNLGSGIKHIFT